MAPETFRVLRLHGRSRLLYGPSVILDYADDDISMRNCVLVALTEAGVLSGRQAGPIFGVRPEQVSRLRSVYRRSGPPGLAARRVGRPAALNAEQVYQARVLAGRRLTHAGIARRLGVPRSVVTETLKRHGGPIGTEAVRETGTDGWHPAEPAVPPATGERLAHGTHESARAGTMLLYAYVHRCALDRVAAGLGPAGDDAGLLAAVCIDACDGPAPLPGDALHRRLDRLSGRIDPVLILGTYLGHLARLGPDPSPVMFVDDPRGPASGPVDRRHATTVAFDPGGVHVPVFQRLRAAGLHWLTYRPPAVRTRGPRPVEQPAARFAHRLPPAWTDEVETTGPGDPDEGAALGAYRQITVYDEYGPALQVLTSDYVTGAAALLCEVHDRWAGHSVRNPAPVNRALVTTGAPPRPGPAVAALPADVRSIRQTTRQLLDELAGRVVADAERWLAHRLHALIGDLDRCWDAAITMLRGMPGTVADTPAGVTVTLHRPDHPSIAGAVEALLHDLNGEPARMPGDGRPITYVLAA